MSKDQKPPPRPKIEIVKAPVKFNPQELLEIWTAEGELQAVVLFGIAKDGSYKYAASDGRDISPGFELISICCSMLQKWSFGMIEIKK
jgi:hypothetical protein